MLKTHFKIAQGPLAKKNRTSFICQYMGLATGMQCLFLLASMGLLDEPSFDKYYKNYDRIAQVRKTRRIMVRYNHAEQSFH